MKSNLKKILCLLMSLSVLVAALACQVPPETPAAVKTEEPAAMQTEVPTQPEAEVPADEPETETEAETEEATEPEEGGPNLAILYAEDDALRNDYSLLAVNESAAFVDASGKAISDAAVNAVGAKALIDWLLSEDGAELIANFGVAEYGEDLFYPAQGRPESAAEIPEATEQTKTIRLLASTTVCNSGLLDFVLPFFEQAYGYAVQVTSVGSDEAIKQAKTGKADLMLIGDTAQTESFVAEGYGKVPGGYDAELLPLMYDWFVLVGPKDDPAGCADAADVKAALKAIADGEHPFLAYTGNSDLGDKEKALWLEALGSATDEQSGDAWYTLGDADSSICLTMANETDSYQLCEKAAFLVFLESSTEIA